MIPARETRFALVVLALLGLLGSASVYHHEPGRDELQPWGIVLSSSSIAELRANYDYESHPRLWFFCLYALSRLTREPFAMQLFCLAFSLSTAFLWLRFAPFPRWVRVLYCLGYLHLYEYGTIARGYTQGEFFATWLCAALPLARARPWLAGVPLFLLAQTSLHGVFLAVGFGAALLADRAAPAGARRAIGACLAAGLVCAGIALLPKPDSDDLGYAWFFGLDAGRLMDALCVFGQAFVPLPNPTFRFWCSNALDAHFGVQLALSLACAAGSFALLRRTPRAALVFALPAAAIVGFAYVKTAGQIRHHGHLFLAFAYALWFAAREAPAAPDLRARALGALLAAHALAGLGAVAADVAWPFSQSGAIAAYLRREGLAGEVLIGEPEAIVAPVAVLLGRPIYCVDTDRASLFVVYQKRDGRFNAGRLAGMLRDHPRVLWLTNRPFEPVDPAAGEAVLAGVPVRFERLTATGEAIRWDERYYLYRVMKRARRGEEP